MFIDLVESLRCGAPHEESWLVASFDVMDGRAIVRGTLGCPVCRRRYPIVDRIAWLGVDPSSAPALIAVVGDEQDQEEERARLTALLNLSEPGGLCILEGRWARLAPTLVELVTTQILAINPDAPLVPAEGISILRTPDLLPIAAAVARGVALGDAPWRSLEAWASLMAGAVHVLSRGGRLLAPSAIPVPPGVRELARDARHWIGERLPLESPPVTLRVIRGR